MVAEAAVATGLAEAAAVIPDNGRRESFSTSADFRTLSNESNESNEGGLIGGPLCHARAGLQHPTVPAEQPTVSRGQHRAG